MVAFSLVVASVYYQIGCGNASYVFVLLVPGIAAQAALVGVFHDSLTVVAQVMFLVNALLLTASLILTMLPLAGFLRLPRLLLGRMAPAAWRPNLPPSD